MPLISDVAVVLQVFSYSETSKILRLLTRDNGAVSVIARGALRPKSRYGGVLEPFTQGRASFYLKPNRDLHNLSGFDLERSRQRLGGDLARFASASLLAELVLHAPAENADPVLFDMLAHWLTQLETAPGHEVEAIGLTAAWSIATQLGFGPELDQCVRCATTLAQDASGYFDYGAGGVACVTCAGHGGRSVPPEALADLRSMRVGAVPSLQRTGAHWALLERFLTWHITDGRPLRTLDFLAEALPGHD